MGGGGQRGPRGREGLGYHFFHSFGIGRVGTPLKMTLSRCELWTEYPAVFSSSVQCQWVLRLLSWEYFQIQTDIVVTIIVVLNPQFSHPADCTTNGDVSDVGCLSEVTSWCGLVCKTTDEILKYECCNKWRECCEHKNKMIYWNRFHQLESNVQ